MPKRLTMRKLDAMIRDEAKGVREYRRYGLNNLARDEAKHHAFLVNLKRQAMRRE